MWKLKTPRMLKCLKNNISNWEPKECYCELCQDYLFRTGYVNLVDD